MLKFLPGVGAIVLTRIGEITAVAKFVFNRAEQERTLNDLLIAYENANRGKLHRGYVCRGEMDNVRTKLLAYLKACGADDKWTNITYGILESEISKLPGAG